MSTAHPSTARCDSPPVMVWPTVRPRIAWLPEALRQLEAIEQLPPGWDSHGGDPPDPKIVDGARILLLALAVAHESLPKPQIHPTPSGGVQFHWESDPKYCEVELVDPHSARFYYADPSTKSETEGELHVGDPLNQLVDFVTRVGTSP